MDDITRKNHSLSQRDVRSAPPVPRQMLQGVNRQSPSAPEVTRQVTPQPQQRPVFTGRPEPEVQPAGLKVDSQDVVNAPEDQSKPKSALQRFLGGYWRRKLWTLPLTVLIFLVVGAGTSLALPMTRYQLLGLFIQRDLTVTVTDSTTGTPVSGATLILDGESQQTDSKGKASVTAKVGQHTLKISKTYYKGVEQSVLVDLTQGKNVLAVTLIATGRQVPVKVVNKITGKPVPDAVITVGDANAKTDTNGQATIVLSASSSTQDAVVTFDGYNDLRTKVQVTTNAASANTFALIPKGKLYFLSNLSGKIDVVSTNLDGSGRKTVLAGTGSEDANNTVLLASRDWQYLALLSKRNGGDRAKLFLITTANDKVNPMEDGSGDITLIGWNGHYFAYMLGNSDLSSWQSGGVALKSYNADSAKATVLATTSASGTSNADAQYENILQAGFVGGNLIYSKTWYRYPGYLGVTGQQNTLQSIKPDGTGGKTLKSVDAGQYYVSSLKWAKPDQLYFGVYDNNSSNANYYRLDASGSITDSSTITSQTVNQSYPTYLSSPSGRATFWSESRDGKNTLFVGDASGNGGDQIATLSDYAPYGWFSDSYVLVQKNRSELYIMSASGGDALKISDYFKPDYNAIGYGADYGL